MKTETTDTSKRKFLGGAAVTAGIVIAPGIMLQTVNAKPDDQPVTEKVRWGLLVNTNQCADGCNDCVTACNTENGIESHGRPETDSQWIRKVTLKDKQTGHVQTLPVMCQHCETAPCADVCPTGASFKRKDGIVLVDKHICIGCRYCMMACPYKARNFVHENLTDQKDYAPRGKGTVEACTLCVHKVDKGENPACVTACNKTHKAMYFGDLNDANSEISKRLKQYGGKQIRADLGLNPGVRYQSV